MGFTGIVFTSLRSTFSLTNFESFAVSLNDLLNTTGYLADWCVIFKMGIITMPKLIEDGT